MFGVTKKIYFTSPGQNLFIILLVCASTCTEKTQSNPPNCIKTVIELYPETKALSVKDTYSSNASSENFQLLGVLSLTSKIIIPEVVYKAQKALCEALFLALGPKSSRPTSAFVTTRLINLHVSFFNFFPTDLCNQLHWLEFLTIGSRSFLLTSSRASTFSLPRFEH